MSGACCSSRARMTRPELTEVRGTYSAFTTIGRPSLSRCLPCNLGLSSCKDRGSESTASSRAESFPQHTALSWRVISSAVASTAEVFFDGAVSNGRSWARTSWSGKNGQLTLLSSCPCARQETRIKKAEPKKTWSFATLHLQPLAPSILSPLLVPARRRVPNPNAFVTFVTFPGCISMAPALPGLLCFRSVRPT